MAVWISIAAPADASDRPPSASMRVLSFNIRFSTPADGPNQWAMRREMVADLLRREACDFVGLQEARPDQVADLSRDLPVYTFLHRTREASDGQGEAVPLGYRRDRWQIDEAEHGTFWLSETPEAPGSRSWQSPLPRIVTWGRFLDRRSGRAVYVYNTHFCHRSELARLQSARLLLQRIADRKHPEPVIVTGDLNAEPSSAPLQTLSGKFQDAFAAIHPKAAESGTFHGFQGGTRGSRIDYIFASAGLAVRDAKILHDNRSGRYPSDHFPLLAVLELASASAR